MDRDAAHRPQAVMDDPETQALLLDSGQIATWETYVSQTIPDM